MKQAQATHLLAMASNLIKIASNLKIAPNEIVMVSIPPATASNLLNDTMHVEFMPSRQGLHKIFKLIKTEEGKIQAQTRAKHSQHCPSQMSQQLH